MPHRTPRTAAATLGAALALGYGPLLVLAPSAAAAAPEVPAARAAHAAPASGVNGADISISPEEVTPGRTVGLVVNCSASFFGTPNPTMVSSMAFVAAVHVHPMPGQPGFFSGATTISQDANPGDYSASGTCLQQTTSLSTFRGTVEVHGRHEDTTARTGRCTPASAAEHRPGQQHTGGRQAGPGRRDGRCALPEPPTRRRELRRVPGGGVDGR
jgi:hypothetical protein